MEYTWDILMQNQIRIIQKTTPGIVTIIKILGMAQRGFVAAKCNADINPHANFKTVTEKMGEEIPCIHPLWW